MRERALQNVDHLLRIAGISARNVAASELHCQRTEIHRRQIVDHAGLQLRAFVGSRRKLSLCQAVHTIVLDDVKHRNVAADHVHELAESDGSGVAVAGDADADQLLVRQHRAGCDRRHPAVHGVESVSASEEVRRSFG